MLRPVLFVVAIAMWSSTAQAAPPDLTGNWLLTSVNEAGETSICILKIATEEGKPTATVVFSPTDRETKVSAISVTDSTLSITLQQSRMIQGRRLSGAIEFKGILANNPKLVLGSTGGGRARLATTDKTELATKELTVPLAVEEMTKVQDLMRQASRLNIQARQEKDAEKKKELNEKYISARKEMEEKSPGLYREVIAKHRDEPVSLYAAQNLIRVAARVKMTASEANALVAIVRKQSEPYGPKFMIPVLLDSAETLLPVAGLESAALAAIEPVAKLPAEPQATTTQSRILAAYAAALNKAGRTAEAKEVLVRWNKVEVQLDAEYLKSTPPFSPTDYAGRKDNTANRTVVMELFTGAQCPPCVAADVAFDALKKAYKPTDLVLLQYHLHIPGPDPLTNEFTEERAEYYDAHSTPSTFFNGKLVGGGGGGMMNAESKFREYTNIINPLLEKTTDVKLSGQAQRNGDKLTIGVEVAGVEGADTKLRLLVVEETIKYVGSNQIRFHHQVVRAMPGGAAGVAISDKSFKHTASVDLAQVRQQLTHYLDDYATNMRPFPRPDRPLDLKGLRVIALVQNDKTHEIIQALQLAVEGKAGARTNEE